MKGSLGVNGTFFYESILIITGCTCTRGIPGTNIELLVSNIELEIAKRDLLAVLNHYFIFSIIIPYSYLGYVEFFSKGYFLVKVLDINCLGVLS